MSFKNNNRNPFVRLVDKIIKGMADFVQDWPQTKARLKSRGICRWYKCLMKRWTVSYACVGLQNLGIALVNLYYIIADTYIFGTVRMDKFAAQTWVGRYFLLSGSGASKVRSGAKLSSEIGAGITTFCAMAYIISANASIVTDTGGPCVSLVCPNRDKLCFASPEFTQCLGEIHRDYITGTAAISGFTTILMGVAANLPIGLAPGMGVNAYFANQVVGHYGSGSISYELALTAVFTEGWIFIALSLCGARQWFARMVPRAVKIGTGVGIGLYLALLGLTYSSGIGLITSSPGSETVLEIAGCIPDARINDYCPAGAKMKNPRLWIAIVLGGFLPVILSAFKFKGSVLVGILLVSITAWPRGTPLTMFPDTVEGNAAWDSFKKVIEFTPLKHTLNVQKWHLEGVSGGQFALAITTFLFMDILDCTGTLNAMARSAGMMDEHTNDFDGSAMAYLVDAFGIVVGSLLGLPPVTAFIESGSGILQGGKTGITAIVTGFLFLVAMFLAPIFSNIPPWATGCTLVIVGTMMCSGMQSLNWRYVGDVIPAFITFIVMPYTESIAYGMVAGLVSSLVINVLLFIFNFDRGDNLTRLQRLDEYWYAHNQSGFLPAWNARLCSFWKSNPQKEKREEPRVGVLTTLNRWSHSAGRKIYRLLCGGKRRPKSTGIPLGGFDQPAEDSAAPRTSGIFGRSRGAYDHSDEDPEVV